MPPRRIRADERRFLRTLTPQGLPEVFRARCGFEIDGRRRSASGLRQWNAIVGGRASDRAAFSSQSGVVVGLFAVAMVHSLVPRSAEHTLWEVPITESPEFAKPTMNYAVRRRRVAAELKSRGLDALVVSKPINVTYLTGFTGDSSYLILDRKSALLVSDGRFTEQIEGECPGLPAHIRPPTTTTPPVVAEVVAKRGHRTVGIEAAHVTVALMSLWEEQSPTIDWTPTTRIVEALRAVKDDDEVREIRDAVGVAERASPCSARPSELL